VSKQKFKKALSEREKTKSIALDIASFDSQEFSEVLIQLGEFPILKEVELTGEWVWDDTNKLPSTLGNLKQVKSLTINLYEVPTSFLPNELGEMKSLERLVINRMEMRMIPDSIGNLRNLRVLDLCQTSIRTLPSSIGALHLLEELSCEECWELSSIPDEMCNLSSLKRLALDGRFLNIPERIGELQQLTQLSLCGHFLTIPENIAKLLNLTKIHLRGRFEKISQGYYSNSKPFQRDTLISDFSNFESISKTKWVEFKRNEKPIPWLVVDDVRELMARPLGNIKLQSSFTKVHLPGEERSDSNMPTSPDGSYCPLVYVSEAIPVESPQTIDGFLPVGVMELPIQAENGRITMFRDERVRIVAIAKDADRKTALACIDSIHEENVDTTADAMLLKDAFLSKNDNFLTPKGMTKPRRAKVIQKFEEDFQRAIKHNRASYLIANALPMSLFPYLDRQLFLLDPNEQARLRRLLKLMDSC
jgi:hypothetical protein